MENTTTASSMRTVGAESGEGETGSPVGAGKTRGGSSVRLMAALVIGCPLVAVIGCLSWGVLLKRSAGADQQRALVQTTATALAEPVRSILDGGEPARLASLLYQVAQDNKLDRCTVELSDGQELANSDRTKPLKLPESWKANGPAPVQGVEGPDRAGIIRARVAVEVGARGTAYVVVTSTPRAPLGSGRDLANAWAGLAGVGVVAVGLMAFLFTKVHKGLRPLAAIQGALRSMHAGERSAAALGVSPRWGAEAGAWNGLLAERESLRRSVMEKQGAGPADGVRAGDSSVERACDAMSQGLMVVDGSLRVRYANGAAAVLLGRKRAEMSGRALSELVTDAPALDLVRTVLGTKGAGVGRRRGSVEVSRLNEGEQSVLRFSATRMPPEPGQASALVAPALVMVEDLTQQRVADQARDTFVTRATHELRTPLTNIRLYVEMLQEEGAADAAVRGKCINVINQESRRLERMVGDMLSVAEIEAGSMKLNTDDVRLEPLMDELRDDHMAQATDKGLKLIFELPPKLPVIRGDRDKIAMSLHNLLGNALKYTPAGGTVTVKVDAGDSGMAVRVQDTGFGIAPDETERIFEKFYRSRDKRVASITGTGLGLVLAREVARLHGGDITVESQLDRGSTFTMTLPTLARAA